MRFPGWRERPPVEGGNAKVALRLLCALAIAAAAAGCAAREPARDRAEARVVSEGAERLCADVTPLPDGSVGLRVWRHRERTVEQVVDSGGPSRRAEPGVVRVAAVGFDSMENVDPVLAAVGAVLGAGYVVTFIVETILDMLNAVARTLGLGTDEPGGPKTVRRVEVSRTASFTVVAVPSDGSGERSLGPQPERGYVLEGKQVSLLGGPGASVTLIDGEDRDLRTTVRLPAGR